MKTHVARVEAAGLCTQCGTCAGVCPTAAVTMAWDRRGYRPCVDEAACTDCGACLAVCPGESFDFADCCPVAGELRRRPLPRLPRSLARALVRLGSRPGDALRRRVRRRGDGDRAGRAQGRRARRERAAATPSTRSICARVRSGRAACRRTGAGRERGGGRRLPRLHLQRRRPEHGCCGTCGARPVATPTWACPATSRGCASRNCARAPLRERVVFALGIFCGCTSEPRATELAARRAGLDPGSSRPCPTAARAGPARCAWRRSRRAGAGAPTPTTSTG